MPEPDDLPVLANEDGASLEPLLDDLGQQFGQLDSTGRTAYRDRNAAIIAAHPGPRLLVVAGPGAGKSYLFMQRIRHWLQQHPQGRIYVASFVRKLVADLDRDVQNSDLPDADKARVTVTTVHAMARSLIERNGGTHDHPLRKHVRVTGPYWERVVWDDVLLFETEANRHEHDWRAMQVQHFTLQFDGAELWSRLRPAYARVCQYLNVVGFPDMIVLAGLAVEENPELVAHDLWIIDEYQDLNAAEDRLIGVVSRDSPGVLLAGDDEQALYEQLKHSLPEIIIGYYDGDSFANAMLPFSSRCGYYITLAASAFIARHRGESAISKVYLPLADHVDATKVQVVSVAAPTSAVDYVRHFIAEHRAELDAYVQALEEGTERDPFLLVLSPDSDAGHLGDSSAELQELLAPWTTLGPSHSPDYRRIAVYAGVGHDPRDNFGVRKLLHFADVPLGEVHELLVAGMEQARDLVDLDSQVVAQVVAKANEVAAILDSGLPSEDCVPQLAEVLGVDEPERLATELDEDPIGGKSIEAEDELELQSARPTAAPIELLTIVGSKGLSAQHVIILGCDNVNMARLSPLAFFVALTRARRSLHIVTALKAKGAAAPHAFVDDLPDDACEFGSYKKTGSELTPLSADEYRAVFERAAYVKKQWAKKKR